MAGNNAPRAWVTISGQTPSGTPRSINGEESLRTVYFDPDAFRVETDTTVTPPRVVVSSPALDEVARELDTLETTVAALSSRVTNAESAASVLAARVTALEAKQFTTTALKIAPYTAAAWEHVLTHCSFGGSFSVTLPASSGPTAGARVRVTDLSPLGSSESISIICTFNAPTGGYYPTSPYVVADDGGVSLAGASIELLDTGAGWVIVSESCKPGLLI